MLIIRSTNKQIHHLASTCSSLATKRRSQRTRYPFSVLAPCKPTTWHAELLRFVWIVVGLKNNKLDLCSDQFQALLATAFICIDPNLTNKLALTYFYTLNFACYPSFARVTQAELLQYVGSRNLLKNYAVLRGLFCKLF